MSFFVNQLPGAELSAQERSELRERFVAAFLPQGARQLPYWFSFPLRPVHRDVLSGDRFKAAPALYLMVSRAASVHRATGAEIASFFAAQLPHEDFDLYVFDDSLEWCIASTGRLVDEPRTGTDFLIVGAGSLDVIAGEVPSGAEGAG